MMQLMKLSIVQMWSNYDYINLASPKREPRLESPSPNLGSEIKVLHHNIVKQDGDNVYDIKLKK